MADGRVLLQVAMLADGTGRRARPGAILVEDGRIVASGTPERVGAPGDARVVRHDDVLALPALVNAHCHLDLSHLPPEPYAGDFTTWIEGIIGRRASSDGDVAASVDHGVSLSRAGGVGLVGDIAGVGSDVPAQVLQHRGMAGVSFVEVFGLGSRQSEAIGRMQLVADAAAGGDADPDGLVLGVQPHAPYTCGLDVYRAASRLGCPISTHLAETPEEIEFTRDGMGPLADLLRRRGVPDEDIRPWRMHPLDALRVVLEAQRHVVAHLNYIEPAHLDLLASCDIHVVYCPRASEFFGHPREGAPPHAYVEMLERGINVALGTDGLPCLDTPDRISPLDDMRLLYRRDGREPMTLLRMATTNGAAALGRRPERWTFAPGADGGIIGVPIEGEAVDPLRDALGSSSAPRWLVEPDGTVLEGPA
jgi:cytosine/adenosine deaminase-related metal-dependent hydrolase